MTVKTVPTPQIFMAQANLNAADYQRIYAKSVQDPDAFWAEQAGQHISWFKK